MCIVLTSADLPLPVVNSRMPPLKDRTYSFPMQRMSRNPAISQMWRAFYRPNCFTLLKFTSGNLARVVCLSDSASSSGIVGTGRTASRTFSFCHDHPVFRRIVTTTLVSRATARAAFNGAECSRKAAERLRACTLK